MAWDTRAVSTTLIKGMEARAFSDEHGTFDITLLTSEIQSAARATARRVVLQHDDTYAIAYADEDAFFDAMDAEAALDDRVDLLLAYTALHHYFWGPVARSNNIDYDKALWYMEQASGAAKALLRLLPKHLTPPTEVGTTVAHSNILHGVSRWGR